MLELNKVYQGDCIELMKQLEDKSIELILTDPPYGVNLEYASYNDTFENWKKLMQQFLPEALRISKKLIFPVCTFPGQVFLLKNFELPKWRLCWHKGSPGQRTPIAGFQDWEEMLIYGNGFKPGIHDYFKVIPDRKKGEFGHPCPKPLKWATWIIERFTKEKEIVLDPFAGSGTVGVAAKQLQRQFLLFEIEQKYCEIAKQRIEDVKLEKSLRTF